MRSGLQMQMWNSEVLPGAFCTMAPRLPYSHWSVVFFLKLVTKAQFRVIQWYGSRIVWRCAMLRRWVDRWERCWRKCQQISRAVCKGNRTLPNPSSALLTVEHHCSHPRFSGVWLGLCRWRKARELCRRGESDKITTERPMKPMVWICSAFPARRRLPVHPQGALPNLSNFGISAAWRRTSRWW